MNEKRLISALKTKNTIAECNVSQTDASMVLIANKLNGLNSYSELSFDDRWSVRTTILCADNFFAQAEKAYLLIDKDKGSIGMIQRYFEVGFNRAARIMEQLEEAGVVGPDEGTKPRQVLMSPEQLEAFIEEGN